MYRPSAWPPHARELFVVAAVIGGCIGSPTASAVPLEVWRSGDDRLTVGLSEKLEEVLGSSPSFTMSFGKPGTLVVTIPRNVDWKKVADRTQVFYSVVFSTVAGHQRGSSSGSCWDDNFAECAEQILKKSEAAAEEIK
jgi:hypothetical protein